MNEHILKTIEQLEGQLQQQMNQVSETKKAINILCRVCGLPIKYASEEAETAGGLMQIGPDEFFGKPLATAVREYLQKKNKAAKAEEIHDALLKGGFEFTGKDTLQALRTSLGKNRAVFVYIKGSDTYGLWKFYGKKPRDVGKPRNGKNENVEDETEPDSEGSDENGEAIN